MDPRLPDPRLDIGVELPPVPVDAGSLGRASLEPWWQLVLASVRAGAGVVWFTGGPAADRPAADRPAAIGRAPTIDAATPLARPLWCDACTLAAAALPLVDDAVLGVVSALPVDRHPAVLARDVTTLDVLSAGRAAVALRWDGQVSVGPTRDRSAVCTYLGEAVAVCRAVLHDEDPLFEGRYLRIAGAVNRPPPSRPSGPPLLVEVPRGIVELVGRDSGVSFLVRQAAAGATAIVCSDDPREIAMWRAQVVDAVGTRLEPSGTGQTPRIVCRTSFEEETPLTGRGNVCSRVEAAHAAGADGLVLRLRTVSPERGGCVGDAADVARVSERLASCFDLWRH